ncbi:50S ribosomal protein L23 [Candidatus Saccharibacteria bacterium]|nr:50S ribosomal protein L23 [Candidatus Saccharibacteria bacterium]
MELIPRATEKTYLEQAKRTYAFIVPKSASKQAVAEAVAEEFKVTVTDVRTLMRKGKATRYSKGKHAYPGTTYRQDKKIAYVTLKDGDSIQVFEEVEEPAKEDKSAKTTDKKSEEKKGDKK